MIQIKNFENADNFFQIRKNQVSFWGLDLTPKKFAINPRIKELIVKYDFSEDDVIEINDDDTYQFYIEVYEKNVQVKAANSALKKKKYKQLVPQIKALIEGESDFTAILAQACAALKYGMDGFFWVGFYFVHGDELVLAPFQGPVACTRIKIAQGVCGACVQRKEAIIVPDVDKFEGHIACSSLSKSEIVLPIFEGDEVIGVLDIDSDEYNMFDEIDKKYLEVIIKLLPHPGPPRGGGV